MANDGRFDRLNNIPNIGENDEELFTDTTPQTSEDNFAQEYDREYARGTSGRIPQEYDREYARGTSGRIPQGGGRGYGREFDERTRTSSRSNVRVVPRGGDSYEPSRGRTYDERYGRPSRQEYGYGDERNARDDDRGYERGNSGSFSRGDSGSFNRGDSGSYAREDSGRMYERDEYERRGRTYNERYGRAGQGQMRDRGREGSGRYDDYMNSRQQVGYRAPRVYEMPTKRKKWPFIVLIILILAIVGAAVWFLFFNEKSPIAKPSANTNTQQTSDPSSGNTGTLGEISVPYVARTSEADAKAALTAAGLVAAVTEGFSDTQAVGNVISQSPAADTMVPAGSTITLTISKGPDPAAAGPTTQIAVPYVGRMTEADAKAAIEAAGLVFAKAEGNSDKLAAGTVISQNPAADTMVDPGSTVTVTVSVGAGS